MFTLRELLQVAKPKEFLLGDVANEQYAVPFWFELVEYPTDEITLELRGWLDKKVVALDVERGLLRITLADPKKNAGKERKS